jgi:hypothetical protein
MNKATLKRRQQQAAALLKAINRIWDSLDKIPSFNGKAPFMDKVKRAQILAQNLHWNLDHDASSE